MSLALNQTGRPILFSLCNWGLEDVNVWGPYVGNMIRTDLDMTDQWKILARNIESNDKAADFARPGAWMDLDFLQVGWHYNNDTMNFEEQKSHFALWCIMKSPLIIAADLRNINREELEIMKNKELIAINQDPNSKQGKCFVGCGLKSVKGYSSTLTSGAKAVVVTNWASRPSNYFFITLNELGIDLHEDQAAKITDLWDTSKVEFMHFNDWPIWMGRLDVHHSRALKIEVVDSSEVSKIEGIVSP